MHSRYSTKGNSKLTKAPGGRGSGLAKCTQEMTLPELEPPSPGPLGSPHPSLLINSKKGTQFMEGDRSFLKSV